MKKKLLLVAASLVLSLTAGEIGLRIWLPNLAADLFEGPAGPESRFQYNDRVGYERTPFAWVQAFDDGGRLTWEQVNSDGFRGPERAVPKPPGTCRILTVGDSVVETFNVSYNQSWEKVLEDSLNSLSPTANSGRRYEVINAGIGGYVSWQALVRLEDRGLKYQPDLVLVLVGWNDLAYASLDHWRPGLNRADIQRTPPGKLWAALRMPLYRYSYVARLARQARGTTLREVGLRTHRRDSGLPFNEQALRLYVQNLERIRQTTTAAGARMGLIVWPTILTPELLDDPDVHQRLAMMYAYFPLSSRELWSWYARYVEVQRDFAARHPDVVLIDAVATLAHKDKKERLAVFPDLQHLTVEGNRALGVVVFQALTDRLGRGHAERSC